MFRTLLLSQPDSRWHVQDDADTWISPLRYINHICKRTATPWEGRFELCVVDTEKYMLICKHVSFEKSGYRSKRVLVISYDPYR